MGLGTKIKEVLHSDKDTKHSTTDTSRTPGAFPSDEVPRSQRHADTSALESTGSPRTDKMHDKKSSEYTYGAHDSSMTGRDGVTSDRHDATGTHTTAGATGSHDRTGSHDLTGSHRNKLSKDSTTAPYWGDSERGGSLEKQPRDAVASTGGRYSPTGEHERHHGQHGSGGRDATYGAPQTHGLTGSGGSLTHGRDGGANTSTVGGGSTSLPHRGIGSDAARRDPKVEEYDAPTNSHGRGHDNLPAGAAAGAAGLGAAALANQHHREDMRDYATQRHDGTNAGRGYNDAYDNTMGPGGNNHYGQGYGGNGMGSHATGTGMGANTVGQHGMGHDNGLGSNHGGMGATRGGVPPGMPCQGPSLLEPHSRNTSPQQTGGAMGHHGGVGGGPGYSTSNAGSEYGGAPLGGGSVMPRVQQHSPQHHNASSGMGDGHFGPGHPGAKVLHRCDHCGNDNDISKYFSKEAVYRMS